MKNINKLNCGCGGKKGSGCNLPVKKGEKIDKIIIKNNKQIWH
jgi:hypothetical protein